MGNLIFFEEGSYALLMQFALLLFWIHIEYLASRMVFQLMTGIDNDWGPWLLRMFLSAVIVTQPSTL
jgi:hypothetical protein